MKCVLPCLRIFITVPRANGQRPQDLNRFPSPIVRVSFEGSDVHEEAMYSLFRPYGKIHDFSLPTPVPAGTPRSMTITYRRLTSATIARNVLYGLYSGGTRLKPNYEAPLQDRAVWNWLSTHPKIVLPVLVFLLGSLSYTVRIMHPFLD